jgi:acyl-coenzyme A thioesterase PaaI-like protein
LVDLTTRTEVSAEVLETTARELRALAPALQVRVRSLTELASVEDLANDLRTLNPVIGAGNPIAPPVRVEIDGDSAVGWCTLGRAYEGPHRYGHGGISALLLDQVLGHAATASVKTGVTRGLTIEYWRPVPLDVPLRIWAKATHVDGRRTTVTGAVTTASDPDTPLVEAEGRFVMLSPDQIETMFAGSAEKLRPETVHD